MSLSNTIVDRDEIDWDTAVAAAEGLGRITLFHVAGRDADAVREWCLRMSHAHVGEGNALRALSCLELAVLTGHHAEEVNDFARRGWSELQTAAEQLVATVRLKASEAVEARKAFEAETKELREAASDPDAFFGRSPDEETEGLDRDTLVEQHGELAVAHSERFRRVSTRYPRRVAEAYEGDLERAAAATDEQVAAMVASWELAQGFEPVDWQAIGAEERGEDDEETGG
jgi:hypothetical protein